MNESVPENGASVAPTEHDSIEARTPAQDAMDVDVDTTKTASAAEEAVADDATPKPSAKPAHDNDTSIAATADVDTDADADADAEVDADADAEADGDAEAEADADGDAEADGAADADGEADVDGDAYADAEPEPESSQTRNRLSNDMLTVIENTANYLSTYQDLDGHQIATHFQRIPNRHHLPDYREIIKEPIAFSTIRTKKLRKQYTDFSEFVRDVALISHNAQVYNRPSSQVFKDAVRLREVLQEELQKLVDDGTVAPEDIVLPDLGEIPDADDDSPDEQEGEDMEDEEDEDEDDDEESSSEEDDDEDDDDDGRGRRRRRGRGGRRSRFGTGRSASQMKRGRPPKVFTPVEARIYSLLQGLRKLKDPDGGLLIAPFEKLPDKASNPDYYTTIANPMALDTIKRKYKRKKYQTVDQAMNDMDLMFDNAKEYNIEESPIYKAAVQLQNHVHELAEQEKARSDNEFVDENGRRPVPEIHHKGEIWHVGEWVHITNPNDMTKPIVAQIFRTWQDRQGQQWINACWYYRPEQTVHRHDKFFLDNEVVKTGQYRDHRIDEVVDRCFVMFVTRYDKGRPRGFPKDKEVYVCKSRYNEENHKFNKIKTWSSCLPDEVRDKDYEMDLFDVPRKVKKLPSPIKHLLRYEAKPTDPLPKATWAAPNAPPLIGAVHNKEREPNESPPPEPTPTPITAPYVEPPHRAPMPQASRAVDGQGDVTMGNTGQFSTIPAQPAPANGHVTPSYGGHYTPRASATPVPVPQYGAHTFQTHVPPPQMPAQAPQYQPHQQHQQHQQHPPPHQTHHAPAFNGYQAPYNPTPVPVPMPPQSHHTPAHQISNPIVPYDPSQRLAPSPARASISSVPSPSVPHGQPNAYNPPRPVEVYKLDSAVNASIPSEIRERFQRDETGHVLFFAQPPLVREHPGVSREHAQLGHSRRYLAERARELKDAKLDRKAKRKERDEMLKETEKKRAVLGREASLAGKKSLDELALKMLYALTSDIMDEADKINAVYDGWSVKGGEIEN